MILYVFNVFVSLLIKWIDLIILILNVIFILGLYGIGSKSDILCFRESFRIVYCKYFVFGDWYVNVLRVNNFVCRFFWNWIKKNDG